jgi:hypothetical protein
MSEMEIQRTDYGRLWQIPERVPHPALEKLLIDIDHLIVLRHGQPPFRVVFGVPHQTAVGVWRICERRLDQHGNVKTRKGDDNAASFALVAFSKLREQNIPCKLVVMAHPTTQDPNKVLDSPYCQEIFKEEMDLLFECHACSSRRHLDLELSAGKNNLTQTIRIGRALALALGYRYKFGLQTVAGESDALIIQGDDREVEGRLQLPATKTASLTEAGKRGIPALHLEAKPFFRVPKDLTNTVTVHGLILGRAMAETIVQLAK